MITSNPMIPTMAPTRMRALAVCGYADSAVLTHVDARPSVSTTTGLAMASSRRSFLGENRSVLDHNSSITVRPNAAAGSAAFWALGAVVGNAVGGAETTGRKQGRPPRGEPR